MDEKSYSSQFVELFSPYFELFPSVYMRHPVAGNDLIIDFVGFEKNNQISGPIGFEIKDPARWDSEQGHFTGFTAALAQCIDYQGRLINSQIKKYPTAFNSRLRYTFLFPVDSTWGHELSPSSPINAVRASGALRLAGKYGVGCACQTPKDWALTLGCHPAYWLKSGPTSLFEKHAVNTRTGSAK